MVDHDFRDRDQGQGQRQAPDAVYAAGGFGFVKLTAAGVRRLQALANQLRGAQALGGAEAVTKPLARPR